jgi:hypothetical protein
MDQHRTPLKIRTPDHHRPTYDQGILTVSVAISEPKPAERRVPVQSAN